MTTCNLTETNVLAQKTAICSSSKNYVSAQEAAICNSETQRQCSHSTGNFLNIVRLTCCYCFQHGIISGWANILVMVLWPLQVVHALVRTVRSTEVRNTSFSLPRRTSQQCEKDR